MSETVRPREEWDVPGDDLGRFQVQMRSWLSNLIASGKVPPAAVAFEALTSALGALEQGVPHEEVRKGYPYSDWQEKTVEVPAALLRVLVEGWWAYRKSSKDETLGKCFGVESEGRGKQNTRTAIEQLGQEDYLARRAQVERLEERVSWEEATERLAEGEKLSAKTVRRASEKHRKRIEADFGTDRGMTRPAPF